MDDTEGDGEEEVAHEEVSKLERVRRNAVADYLRFFRDHHAYFKSGIKSRDGETVWVPPITIDEEAIDALPSNGRPDGLIVKHLDDEVIEDDDCAASDDEETSEASDDDADAGSLDINGSLIARWLRDGDGNIARALRASDPDSNTDRIMSALFGVEFEQTVRPSSLKLSKLVRKVIECAGRSDLAGDHSGDISVVSDVVYTELRSFVAKLGVQLNDSGAVHGTVSSRNGETPVEEAVRELKEAIDGDGTASNPFDCPRRGEVPLSEKDAPGYMTLAFPTLFPFGLGSLSESRPVKLEMDQWMTHLHNYSDGRFQAHSRWAFFAQNTRERSLANDKAVQYVTRPGKNDGDDFASLTVGELKALSKDDKYKVMSHVSKFGRSMRNTPEFFKDRRKELQSMCDALGDPHVFATHSFADTFCPYLAEFILAWQGIDRDGGQSPFQIGINDKEAKSRRWKLLEANPALAAHFFALKTELYLEHICVGILGAQAFWSRYEWQSRGSTHAHYFLWLRDTPQVNHLDEWVRQELEKIIADRHDGTVPGDNDEPAGAPATDEPRTYTESDLKVVEKRLNERALADGPTRRAAEFWRGFAQHHNEAWDDAEQQPDLPANAPHPATRKLSDLGDLSEFDECEGTVLRGTEAPAWLVRDIAFCRNMMTRHTDHVPYCLRRNKATGEVFCRFHYPLEGHAPVEEAHFYVERSGARFRWKINLGINDRLINSVNLWQMAAHRANVDFRPLFDHHTAVEYATKYATKAEKGSKAQETIFAHAISRASNKYDDDASAQHAYASFLVQTVGARDWSSQEVGHVAFGHATCISSHKFDYATLSTQRALLPDIKYKEGHESATGANKWDLYLRRIEFASHHKKGDPRQQTMEAFYDRVHQAEMTCVDDNDHIVSCSFHQFYSHYTFASAGANSKGRRNIVRRKTPTVVVIKPRMPKFWCDSGHPKRRDYCRNRLLLHRPFLDLAEYVTHMQDQHWDWESAYEDFALSDDAPATVRDDFRNLEFEEEGEEVEGAHRSNWTRGSDQDTSGHSIVFLTLACAPSACSAHVLCARAPRVCAARVLGARARRACQADKQPMLHGRYSMFETHMHTEATIRKVNVGAYDWEGETQSNFTDADVNDSATWMTKQLKQSDPNRPVDPVDLSLLNPAQAFAYNVVRDHNASATRAASPAPLRALVCGTAGSGKVRIVTTLHFTALYLAHSPTRSVSLLSSQTFLIRALKQLLGGKCLVLAPTGVAAENIGGATYHSQIPVPFMDIDRVNIDPAKERMASFEKRLAGVEYIIIDEMSMVGRRAIGHIDYLLTKAKGDNSKTFGGLSIILVGDHGQLPPVKDKRPYDVSGVRHARTGKALVTAPKWQLRGVQRYEEFTDIFFLDKIERIAKGGGDASEIAKLNAFRDLQLRARDGLLRQSDHGSMRATMDLDGMREDRRATFHEPEVFSLVTTQSKRDQANLTATTALLDSGAPGIVLNAVHSPENSPATVADDDDIGLAKTLVLARGSRVMVTWNISVDHGLVNGTVGKVAGFLVKDGIAASVLVAVRKASTGRNGYSGPSFVPAANYNYDDNEYAIVAIGRKSVKIHENKMDSQRSQFPLMLAHAVTVHKAQGLTLDRIRIDAGDDERSVGLFFVALTRVRHPEHIAFDPMPDRDRVTTNIATKPALRKRKIHERQLRKQAQLTKEKYASAKPPPDQIAPATPNTEDDAISVGGGGDTDDDEVPDLPDLHGPGADNAERPFDATGYYQSVFDHQNNLLSNIGLDGIFQHTFAAGPMPPSAPDWIATAKSQFTMTARVIDYNGHGTSERFSRFLRFLGFEGTYEHSVSQIGSSCAIVAARIIAMVQLAKHVNRRDWLHLDTTSAVHSDHVLEANQLIQRNPARHTRSYTCFLRCEHIQRLYTHWLGSGAVQQSPHAAGTCAFCASPAHSAAACPQPSQWVPVALGATLDQAYVEIASLVHDLASNPLGPNNAPRRAFVTQTVNTEDSRSRGYHWFTVVVSIEPREQEPPPPADEDDDEQTGGGSRDDDDATSAGETPPGVGAAAAAVAVATAAALLAGGASSRRRVLRRRVGRRVAQSSPAPPGWWRWRRADRRRARNSGSAGRHA